MTLPDMVDDHTRVYKLVGTPPDAIAQFLVSDAVAPTAADEAELVCLARIGM